MLVLTRKVGESILVGDQISIAVVRIDGNKVRIGVSAPDDMIIRRGELQNDQALPRSLAQQAKQSLRTSRHHLLIVDDNQFDREMYRKYLGDVAADYDISETDCGEDGLRLCKSIKPDCVLLDYRLPDLDGVEFLEELSHEKGLESVPVVMVTRFGNEELVVEAMKRGATDYLIKDRLTSESLRGAIHGAIARWQTNPHCN